ncbi:hypothetical protein C8T65DRAFT_588894, partial [Cerioporus squamosus]
YPDDLEAVLRSSARPNHLRDKVWTRPPLSNPNIFLTTPITTLGSASKPLIPHYFPVTLNLCTRMNKVFVRCTLGCIAVLIDHTQVPLIIHTIHAVDPDVDLVHGELQAA